MRYRTLVTERGVGAYSPWKILIFRFKRGHLRPLLTSLVMLCRRAQVNVIENWHGLDKYMYMCNEALLPMLL